MKPFRLLDLTVEVMCHALTQTYKARGGPPVPGTVPVNITRPKETYARTTVSYQGGIPLTDERLAHEEAGAVELGDGLAPLPPQHAVVPHHQPPPGQPFRRDSHESLGGSAKTSARGIL